MTEERESTLDRAREDVLRALSSRLGLTPQQISALKLSQVHLATSTLSVEPDEFAPGDEDAIEARVCTLDSETQRALIAWLVSRPDGPNDHLFPGDGWQGLGVGVIEQVLGVVEAEPPSAPVAAEEATPSAVPISAAEQPEAAPAVDLDEIEALRKELAAADEGWAPVTEPQPVPSDTARAVPRPRPPGAPTSIPEAIPELAPPPEAVRPRPASPPPPPPPRLRVSGEATARPQPPRAAAPRRVVAPAPRPIPASSTRVRSVPDLDEDAGSGRLPYPVLGIVAAIVVIACCGSLAALGFFTGAVEDVGLLVGGIVPGAGTQGHATPTPLPTEPIVATTVTSRLSPTPTETPAPTDTPTPEPTNTPAPTPAEAVQTPTPIIIVVTATPTPEPPPTVRREPTNTPVPAAPAEEAEVTSAAAPEPEFKYPAPTLLEPPNNSKIQGTLAILKWEPVGVLADNEYYALRFVYLQQGQPVYQGDDIRETEWRVPERFYYQADGPALLYRWYVTVERKNADGTTTQLSPRSEEFVYRWE